MSDMIYFICEFAVDQKYTLNEKNTDLFKVHSFFAAVRVWHDHTNILFLIDSHTDPHKPSH